MLRAGRISKGQQRAWDAHWPDWGLQLQDGELNAAEAFGRKAPLILEIGFGMGQSLAQMALNEPETNWLGIEVHPPGVGKLMHTLAQQNSDNVRIYSDDAVQVLQQCIAAGSLDGVQIFFPDPWHKKRHHKRRLIQPEFVKLLAQKIRSGGRLHLATDWENYAEQMLEVLEASDSFTNDAKLNHYSPRQQSRPLTKFEKRGQRLGHGVWDLLYSRN